MRLNGHANLNILVSLSLSVMSALVFFPIFIGLRAMAGSSPAARADGFPPPHS